jgi:hypothetical protein
MFCGNTDQFHLLIPKEFQVLEKEGEAFVPNPAA